MNTIWIVEYGNTDMGEADSFSSAFSTKEKAKTYALACANEMKNEMNELEDGEYTTIELDRDPVQGLDSRDADYAIELRASESGYGNDWWIVRGVPFDR